MTTTQSADPNERVDHPRHYNQHPSNIETIELIEHLSCNLGCAVKYIWRCGLKQSETPLRDLASAKWYTYREQQRIDLFELDEAPPPKTDVVWRSLARRVIASDPESALSDYLQAMLQRDFYEMIDSIDAAILELNKS